MKRKKSILEEWKTRHHCWGRVCERCRDMADATGASDTLRGTIKGVTATELYLYL